jgi:hypothetical protein
VETVSSDDERTIPSFQAQICLNCSTPIRGTRFHCIRGCFLTVKLPKDDIIVEKSPQRPIILCETCARSNAHQPNHLEKMHKDCILALSMSSHQDLQVCSCPRLLSRRQQSKQIYPFRAKDRRLHEHNCGLLQLSPRYCQTKYEELTVLKKLQETSQKPLVKAKVEPRTSTLHSKQTLPEASSKLKGSFVRTFPLNRFKPAVTLPGDTVLKDSPTQNVSFCQGYSSSPKGFIANTKEKLKRTLFRPLAQVGAKDIPYGNVHMALMFGPLLIENGIREYVSLEHFKSTGLKTRKLEERCFDHRSRSDAIPPCSSS